MARWQWMLGIFLLFPVVLQAETFRWEETPEGCLKLWEGEKPVWCYQYRQKIHENVPVSDLRRVAGCYFHPLYGLEGEILTANATLFDNHAHHHGVWASFMTFLVHHPDGSETFYDTWTDDTAVKKDFVGWLERKVEGETFVLGVQNGCFRYENGERKEKYLDEKLWVTTHAVAEHPLLGRHRAIDWEYSWTACDDPITLAGDRPNGKNFCSLAIRFAVPKEKTTILVPEGEIAGDPLQCPVSWVDYQDRFIPGGKRTGVALLASPKNPPHPGGMAIRHYGMLVAGYPGVEGSTLKPGETVTLKYRIWIHENLLSSEAWQPLVESFR